MRFKSALESLSVKNIMKYNFNDIDDLLAHASDTHFLLNEEYNSFNIKL